MKQDQPITLSEAKSIRQNYLHKNRGKTQQAFFEYNKLMDYLVAVGEDLGKEKLDKAGIKIYFGQYDAEFPEHNENRVTVMLVPTLRTEDNVNQDILNMSDDADPLLYNVLEAFNHGALCPPFDGRSEHDTGVDDICAGSDLNG
ncbi:hypothetical protein MUGA111182_13555 [Mucilaginibacter galii]|uniref:Uncharacterized protein n=1 Tax=Mucilaginibacter galii TaxID=2005073 RepID=A0A917J843_9SPHI|nr:hypothetical protein [Mucilaginibacter galii]GGI49211.1 hypothetical protein GCM10011425_04230 [Mucilaginibacter galii]